MRGGARYTHATLLAANLDYLAIEAQIAQEELAAGVMSPAEAAGRFGRFSAEVEKLAREGVRHLRLIHGGSQPVAAGTAGRAA